MLGRRHETLNEELLRQSQAAGGITGSVPPVHPAKRSRSNRTRAGSALYVVGGIWLALGAAFTLWGVWDYNHTEMRTVTITRVAAIPTAGEDDCDFAALPGGPAGRWSGDCPPGAVVGQEVELFINPDGMVWDSPGSMAAMIAVSGAVTVLGALALFGLGWFLNRPRTATRGAKGKAGWRPDPDGRPTMRYWDGRTWTAWDLEGWTEQNRANPAPPPLPRPVSVARQNRANPGPRTTSPPPTTKQGKASAAYAQRLARIPKRQLDWGRRVSWLIAASWCAMGVLWLTGESEGWIICLFLMQYPLGVLAWELLGRPPGFWRPGG